MADDTKLSFTAKWELDRIDEAAKKLRAEVERLENLLDEQTGVVQALKPYPVDKITYQTCLTSFKSPEAARKAAETAYAESMVVKDENAQIAVINNGVKIRIKAFIDNAKIPHTVQVRVPRKRYGGYTTQEAEWYSHLLSAIPTYDGWSTAEQRYKDWLRQCDEWEKRTNAEVEAKRRTVEAQQKKEERERTLGALLVKYELPINTDVCDLLTHLLNRDKYLRLAHYLCKNRGDWNDGCSYAETGLDGFKVETETDNLIYNEISGLCSDWGGDGRCFRDCNWCYDVLFNMANQELYADYSKVAEMVND